MKTVYLPAKDALSRAINWLSTSMKNIWARLTVAESKIDTLEGDYLPRSGGEITGPIFFAVDPSADDHLARKGYVDAVASGAVGGYLPLSGGTLTGLVAFGSHIPTCTADPSSASQLVRLGYLPTAYLARAGGTDARMTGDLHMGYYDAGPPPVVARNQIKWLANGTDDYDAICLAQANSSYLALSGGTVTGDILRAADPGTANALARRSYVEAQRDTRVAKAGDTMSGTLNMGTVGAENKIQHLAACTADTDAANKKYADDRAWASTGVNAVWSTPPHHTDVTLPSSSWTEITRITVDYINTTTDVLLMFHANARKHPSGNGANAVDGSLRWVHDPDGTPAAGSGILVTDFTFLNTDHRDHIYVCMDGRELTGGSTLTGSQTWAVEMYVSVSSGTGNTAVVNQQMITAFVK